ncbi:MAG: TetR/AcrR family transcriptional regulator [Bacilli bacterium]
MPKTKQTYDQMKEDRRRSILKASLRLFAVRGYDAVRMDDIAKKCECSHGLLYHYYKDKEDIFHDLMNYLHSDVYRFNLLIHEEKVSAKEQIIHICDAIINIINGDEDRFFSFYMFTNIDYQKTLPPPPVRDGKGKIHHKFFDDILKEIIIQGQKEGTVHKGDPKELTLLFHSLMYGMLFDKLKNKREKYSCPSSKAIQRILLKTEGEN